MFTCIQGFPTCNLFLLAIAMWALVCGPLAIGVVVLARRGA